MTARHITLACGDYDRTHGLVTGAVSAAGLEINFLAEANPSSTNVAVQGRSVVTTSCR